MAEEGKTYVCRLCGQEVTVTKAGVGTLVCCDQPMELEEE
jgi:desulfoferrodoxin-like iron-binding protein